MLVLGLFAVLTASTVILLLLFREKQVPQTPFGWTAQVSTLAGDGAPGFRDSSSGTRGGFSDPFGIAVGPDGSIYVADAGESNRIRKLAKDQGLTTLAGGIEGNADGQGPHAAFNSPSGIALDASGNLYVADTGNNRIRKVDAQGAVLTVAGDGTAGYRDGPAAEAQFNGPIGVTVDGVGNVIVADTYNDRIRMITPDGQVSTIAGSGRPGFADGDARDALFDTPCSVVAMPDGTLIVADTGNNSLRRISTARQVTTLSLNFSADIADTGLRRPIGLALTDDQFLYVTEPDRARIIQVAPDGAAQTIAGGTRGFADGSEAARFNQPMGIAVDRAGDLYVADSANYLVRKLSQSPADSGTVAFAANGPLPHLTNSTLLMEFLLWPLDPQRRPHEIVATVGEVRGSFDSTDRRERLHTGIDVFGAYGNVVRTILSEKVASPLPNWGFGSLNEGLRVGMVAYIHMHVGRDKDNRIFTDTRFMPLLDEGGKLFRIRVRRGTRFQPGDALGTINRMYHVHLNVGPPGGEMNPLALTPVGFKDDIAPQIERDGIQLFNEAGERFVHREDDHLVVSGGVRIVVEAFDRNNLNSSRRKLGLYKLGYQVLKKHDGSTEAGAPVRGFESPLINIEFNRLPTTGEVAKLAYAEESGITVYGSKTTRFLYQVTNTVRDGVAAPGFWDTSLLPRGDYVLRIIAADFSGNEAQEGRDISIRVK